jgi:hypothetical protein
MNRNQKLKLLEKTRKEILETAAQRGIDLQRVECMLPFAEGDFGLDVWFFFGTQRSVALHDRTGVTRELAESFLAALRGGNGTSGLDTGINFRFVSAENPDAFTRLQRPLP